MNYKDHLKSGAILSVVAYTVYTDGNLVSVFNMKTIDLLSFSLGLAIGSGLPDIDHSKSYISKKLSVVGWMSSKFFSHRGLTHSLFFNVLLSAFFVISKNYINPIYIVPYSHFFVGIILGSFFHMLMDMFIGNGVALLSPFSKKKFAFLKINSKSHFCKFFNHLLVIASGFFIIFYNKK